MPSDYVVASAGYADFARRMASLPAVGAGPDGASWVRRLPSLLAALLDEWQLVPADAPVWGGASLVVPVQRDDQRFVVKVSRPTGTPLTEHVALRAWGGRAAARLIAADPARHALLLEHLDATTDLVGMPIDEACEIIGQLMARLALTAPPTIPTLSDLLEARVDQLRTGMAGIPRRVASRATALFDDLSTDRSDQVLLHGDLHFGHVLRGNREPWLSISPRPAAGPREAGIHAVLRHRVAEHGTGSAFRWTVRRRLDIVADAAGLDVDLARLWSIVHASLDAVSAADAGRTEGTSFHLALAKALEE